MTRDESCGTCAFYFQESGENLCRRWPPSVEITEIQGGSAKTISVFPSMQPHGWCGEYAPAWDRSAH